MSMTLHLILIFSNRPIFLQDKSHSAEERQKFFDDYQPDGKRNYWIRDSDRIVVVQIAYSMIG